jgi:hypothetical protein
VLYYIRYRVTPRRLADQVIALFFKVPSDGFFKDLRDDFEVDLTDDLADDLGANLVIAFLASAADTFSLGLS